MDTRSKAKVVSATRSRRPADWGRSRAIAPRGPSGPVHEAAAAHRGRVQRRAAAQLSYEATQYITWVTSGAMAHAASRVGVARARSRHSVTGRLRRVHLGPTRAHGGRVERRVGTRLGFGQLIPPHTRATVPCGRSRAAHRVNTELLQILVPLKGTRAGKGLNDQRVTNERTERAPRNEKETPPPQSSPMGSKKAQCAMLSRSTRAARMREPPKMAASAQWQCRV